MARFAPLAALAVLTAAPALAADPDPAAGAALFERHCAMCHGAAANGTGPLAPSLIVQPRNLTALSQENGGEFPLLRVASRIDGREPLVSHGSPMPVFGPYFEGPESAAMKTATGQPVMMSQPVADLIAWLQQIQK